MKYMLILSCIVLAPALSFNAHAWTCRGLEMRSADLKLPNGMQNRSRDSKNSRYITCDQFGDRWPLTVHGGLIICHRGDAVSIVSADHNNYALNGLALSSGFDNIRPIWADNPSIPGTKKDLSPLVDIGSALCD